MKDKQKYIQVDEALIAEAYKISNAANTHKVYSLLNVYLNSAELINNIEIEDCLKDEFENYFLSASIELKKFITKEKLSGF
jgi:hypothetical protein